MTKLIKLIKHFLRFNFIISPEKLERLHKEYFEREMRLCCGRCENYGVDDD